MSSPTNPSQPARRHRPTRRSRGLRGALALTIAVLCATTLFVPSATAAPLPVGTLSGGIAQALYAPRSATGANDWFCRPSAAHPRPVVLVHGTLEAVSVNWSAMAPLLRNNGYCVFTLSYGETLLSLNGRLPGLGDIAGSARQLSTFIDTVRFWTGSSKVDIVGHSQGGMMPNHYLKKLGGASKVGTFVGLSPSNHGTTLSGITNLGQQLGILGIAEAVLGVTTPALSQQIQGSSFQTNLFAGGDTVAGPRYAVITTTKDLVVTPHTNGYLSGPNVENITIQNQCPTDPVGHIGISYDWPAQQNVLNELGPNVPNFKPVCSGFGIGV
jgi:triacylglycerol esterase/lipase EstA (alpha/beta hydrolase family)